jgi:hypothetical protein
VKTHGSDVDTRGLQKLKRTKDPPLKQPDFNSCSPDLGKKLFFLSHPVCSQ